MILGGFDLSLTCSGLAVRKGTSRVDPRKLRGAARLRLIRDEVVGFAVKERVDLAVIEGYSFGSKGRATFSIGEMGGVVRLGLIEAGIPFVAIPPTSLKKFALGKGGGADTGKDAMIEAAIRKFGFVGHGNDEADAWLLLMMAQAAFGNPSGLTVKQREAIAGVDWTPERP